MYGQYVQVDMVIPYTVSGMTIQGGFYEEQKHTLMDRRDAWVTQYVVSYANNPQGPYLWVRGQEGDIKVSLMDHISGLEVNNMILR